MRKVIQIIKNNNALRDKELECEKCKSEVNQGMDSN